MHIQVETDRMRSAADDLRTTLIDLHTIMDNIETLVLSLNGAWQGDAEVAYAGRIVHVKTKFGKLDEFFNSYADLLDSLSERYDNYENELSSQIEGA